MKYSTWEAIAKRHVWYRELLVQRMAEWPEKRIRESDDFDEIAAVGKLASRSILHQERMQRHLDRGMQLLPTGDARH